MTPPEGEAAIALAAELVRIPSFAESGEAVIAERLAHRLDAAGLSVELRRGRGRTSVVARLAGSTERPICLSGHLDTVGVRADDWARDPFAGEVVDDMLHGRGACDMKAGVAAAVVAAERWASIAADRRPGLLVILTGGEELGCEGARSIADDIEPASTVVVLEPTNGQPRLGHRGVAWLDVTITGVAAHASAPHLGRSAIAAAARAIVALDALEHDTHAVLGRSTLNVGEIAGGSAANVVADRCSFSVDVRLLPGQSAHSWVERVQAAIEEPASVDVRLELPAVLLDRGVAQSHDLLRALDLPVPSGAAAFFTDACILAGALDAPAILWGPGDPALAHATDERCPTAQIAAVAERLARLPGRWRIPA